jgi:hypothetical protein
MKTLLLAVAILIAAPTFARQHAPTAEVCKADVAVWYDAEMATEYYNAQKALAADKVPNRTGFRTRKSQDCCRISRLGRRLQF